MTTQEPVTGEKGMERATELAPKKAFRITRNKGFHITFENGVTLSTQFGWGNYCDNYDLREDDGAGASSTTAEIAMWDRSGKWITTEFEDRGDDVLGRVDLATWLRAVDFCRNYGAKAHHERQREALEELVKAAEQARIAMIEVNCPTKSGLCRTIAPCPLCKSFDALGASLQKAREVVGKEALKGNTGGENGRV